MRTLKTYLSNETIDGHIHLFDHTGIIGNHKRLTNHKCVGFMDVDFMKLDQYDHEKVMGYYDTYIRKHRNPDTILLATGTDCDTMIDLYLTYPDTIKGFGEIKCYSYYNDDSGRSIDLPYGNLNWIRPLCDFDRELKLPIFLHWYVFDDMRRDELDRLLTDYPSIPFVLCHCGLSPFKDYQNQYEYVVGLILKHNNLYVDISFDAMEFFIENPDRMRVLNGRCFLGSDLNPTCVRAGNEKKYLSNFHTLYNYKMKFNDTVKNLFHI